MQERLLLVLSSAAEINPQLRMVVAGFVKHMQRSPMSDDDIVGFITMARSAFDAIQYGGGEGPSLSELINRDEARDEVFEGNAEAMAALRLVPFAPADDGLYAPDNLQRVDRSPDGAAS